MKEIIRLCHKTLFFSSLWITLSLYPALSISEIVSEKQTQSDFVAGNKIIPLSGTWKFKSGELENISKEDTGHWEDISVPANWYLAGKDISGVAWYSKFFTLPVIQSV